MRPGLATLARNKAVPSRRPIQEKCCRGSMTFPADDSDRRGEGWRQTLRLVNQAPALCETGVLIPVGVIDQRIALARAAGRSGDEAFVGSGHSRSSGARRRIKRSSSMSRARSSI
jgi:hypothetical protein